MTERRMWQIRDFSEGLIDRVEDHLLPENAARDCQNFISRSIGSLTKRRGQARLTPAAVGNGPVQGVYAYYFGTPAVNRRLVAAAGGTVAWWNTGTQTWSNLVTGHNAVQPAMFETGVNFMVCFNGVNPPWRWDGTTVANLANAPADGRYPTLYKEKLFVVRAAEPSTLRWSNSFQIEQWPAVNFWHVKLGDGDEITCLRAHLGQLVIFKRRSIHILRGTDMVDFRMDEIDSRLGCVGPLAAAAHGPLLYFVSEEGLCVFNGVRAVNLSSERIPELWARVNKAQLHRAAVGIWDNLVWFALPEGTSTANNLIIAYDESGRGGGKFWPWRGINASCFQPFDNGNQVVLYSGDSLTGTVNQQDVSTDDFGSPINAYWVGKAFDQGMPEHEKKAKRAFAQDSPDTPSTVSLQVSLDYGPFAPLELRSVNRLIREFRFPYNARWQYLTPRIEHTARGACDVRGIMVPFRVRPGPRART